MSTKRLFLSLILAIAAGLSMVAAQQAAPADSYRIGSQDVLSLTCFDDASVTGKYIVQPDGEINLPLIGSVKVAGLTIVELETQLKKRFQDGGFFNNPRITVAVEQYKSQKVIIQGEVRAPGQYTLTGGMHLLELIALAGSMLPSASGEVVVIRNKVPDQPEVIRADLGHLQNGVSEGAVALQNGDVVIVQQADRAYVLGEVKNPNAYPVRRDTTLMQLLSLAGGPTADAATGRIKIIRTVDGKQVEINKAKLTEIVKPGDTIVVPVRFF